MSLVNPTDKHEPKAKKRKQKIIEEEDYVNALSEIIKRDFFPDLNKLEAQFDYWKALEDNDYDKLEAASAKMFSSSCNALESLGVAKDIKLDEFQQLYTSQDNASFQDILHKMNCERSRKYAWVRAQEEKSTNSLPAAEQRLLLKEGEGQNALMFIPKAYSASEKDSELILNHSNTRLVELNDKMKYSVAEGGLYQSNMPMRIQKRKNYAPVESTPLIEPGRDVEAIMTWGFVESTPIRLPPTASQFHIPPTPKREEIAKQLSAQAAKNIRKRAGKEVGDASQSVKRLLSHFATPKFTPLAQAKLATPLFKSGATPVVAVKTPKNDWNFLTPKRPL